MILQQTAWGRTQEEIASLLVLRNLLGPCMNGMKEFPVMKSKFGLPTFLVRRCRSFFIPRLSTISAHKKGRTSMNEVSLKPVIEELENLFSKFNAQFFADKLEKPVITVSPVIPVGPMAGVLAGRLGRRGREATMKSTCAPIPEPAL